LHEVRNSVPDLDGKLLELLAKIEEHLSGAPGHGVGGRPRSAVGHRWLRLPHGADGSVLLLRHPDSFRAAVEEVIALGGDADSTGAIVGGMPGPRVGAQAIPVEWLDGLLEWPRSVAWMRKLAERLANQFSAEGNPDSLGPLPSSWPGLIARNLLFLLISVLHGFRRLLRTY